LEVKIFASYTRVLTEGFDSTLAGTRSRLFWQLRWQFYRPSAEQIPWGFRLKRLKIGRSVDALHNNAAKSRDGTVSSSFRVTTLHDVSIIFPRYKANSKVQLKDEERINSPAIMEAFSKIYTPFPETKNTVQTPDFDPTKVHTTPSPKEILPFVEVLWRDHVKALSSDDKSVNLPTVAIIV